MSKKVDVSPRCTKRKFAYATEEKALAALFEVKIRRGTKLGGRSRENGAYLCPICPHAFHLTSRALA